MATSLAIGGIVGSLSAYVASKQLLAGKTNGSESAAIVEMAEVQRRTEEAHSLITAQINDMNVHISSVKEISASISELIKAKNEDLMRQEENLSRTTSAAITDLKKEIAALKSAIILNGDSNSNSMKVSSGGKDSVAKNNTSLATGAANSGGSDDKPAVEASTTETADSESKAHSVGGSSEERTKNVKKAITNLINSTISKSQKVEAMNMILMLINNMLGRNLDLYDLHNVFKELIDVFLSIYDFTDNPSEIRYRRVPTKNKQYQKAVASIPEAIEVLSQVGFVEKGQLCEFSLDIGDLVVKDGLNEAKNGIEEFLAARE